MSPMLATRIQFKPRKVERRSSSPWRDVRVYDECPSWLPEAREQITRLECLEDNWDSYGSRRVQPAAIRTAIRFLFEISRGSTPMPHIAPVPGGGLGFHWLEAGRDLEVEFTAEGGVKFLKSYPGSDREPEEGAAEEASSVLAWLAGM